MTIREALAGASRRIAAAEGDTPWLDAVVLLSATLGMRREELFASYHDSLGRENAALFDEKVARRVAGVPVAYITGWKEFFGLDFAVDERVLIPRPDTEILVEQVLGVVDRDESVSSVHDCCTGSGCIAVALAYERPRLAVSASDLSADALTVARDNAVRLLGKPLPLYQSDTLADVPGRFDIITANAPYLTTSEVAEMAERNWPEPLVALDAGSDGLLIYRRLILRAVDSLWKGGYLFVEIADNQSEVVSELLESAGFSGVRVARDLAGRRRVCSGQRT